MIKAHTLRFRMIVHFCSAVSVLLIASYLGFFVFLARQSASDLERQFQETAGPILTELVANPQAQNVNSLNLRDQYFEVLDVKGRMLQASKNLVGRTLDISVDKLDLKQPAFLIIPNHYGKPFRAALFPYRIGTDAFILVLAVPNREVKEVLEIFGEIMALFLPLSLLLTVLLSTWYVKRSLAPITALTVHARRMTEIMKSEKREHWTALPVDRPDDELGHLAETFNQLFSQVDIALHQLRQFVTDASHELRTPLSVLRGETELILSEPRSNSEYEKTLYVIDAELRKLTRIVEGLFTISMADAGQLRLLQEPVYLNEILEEACCLAASRSQSKNIVIVRDFRQDVPYKGDEAFLRQLFLVFLDNSVKYSSSETSINVSLEKANSLVRVKFEDQGIGISSSDIGHIFERFYRAVPRSNGETQSGGLGLAIAQAIVQAHGGLIECQSSIGRGSTFSITLPFDDAEAPLRETSCEMDGEHINF
jgi:two-component system OmpR family sensor kinase